MNKSQTRAIQSFAILILIITGQLAYGQQSEETLVKQLYDNYKAAILNDNGKKAVKYIDSNTIKYYTTILELVKTADSAKIASLSILDRLMVFSVKHRASTKDILRFNGKALLIYAIKSGMVGKASVANHSVGDVTIYNDFAKGQFMSNGKETQSFFHFRKENKQWKIDLTSLFPPSTISFKKMADESGQDQNEFLFYLLEMATGKKPRPEMWKPVVKKVKERTIQEL